MSELKFRKCKSLDDLSSIVKLAQEAHLASRFSHITFAPAKVEKEVQYALEHERSRAIFFAESRNSLVGMLGCSAGEFHIGVNYYLTTIHMLYVQNAHRTRLSGGKAAIGLLQAVEAWSRSRGVSEIILNATAGIESKRTDKLMTHLGFLHLGGNYTLKLRLPKGG